MAMDVPCRDSSELLGSLCSLCSQCWEGSLAEEWEGREPRKSTGTTSESLSLTVDGLLQRGEGCGERENKKRESVSDKLNLRKKTRE